MKKFLSILLAVMMVLSTVSFAAPSLAGVSETAVDAPVVDVPVEEAEATADLAATAGDKTSYGTLVYSIDFEREDFDVAAFTTGYCNVSNPITAYLNPDFDTSNLTTFSSTDASGFSNASLVTEGDNTYITGDVNSGYSGFFRITKYNCAWPTGYYTFVADVKSANAASWAAQCNDTQIALTELDPFDTSVTDWQQVAYQTAEAVNGADIYGFFMTPNNSAAGTINYDNWEVYYRPAAVTLTIDGNEYEVSTDAPVSAAALAGYVTAPTGYILDGISLTEGGESITGEQYFFEDTTLYATYKVDDTINPAYGKKIVSFSFDDASKFSTELCTDSYSQFSIADVADYYDASHNLYVLQYYVPYTGVPSFTNGYSQSSMTAWGSINIVTTNSSTFFKEGVYTIAFDMAADVAVDRFAISQDSSAYTLLDAYSHTDADTFDHVVLEVAKDHLASKYNLQIQIATALSSLKVDNLEVYYRPNTVDVTLVYGGEEYVVEDVSTAGVSADSILTAAGIDIPYGKKAVLSATQGGESVGNAIKPFMDSKYYVSFVADDSITEYGKRLFLIDFEDKTAGDEYKTTTKDNLTINNYTSNYNADWGHLTINWEAGNNVVTEEDGNKFIKGQQGWAQVRINNADYASAPAGYYTMQYKTKNYGYPTETKTISSRDQNTSTDGTFVDAFVDNGEWDTVAAEWNYAAKDYTLFYTSAMTTDVAFDDVALYYRPASVNLTVVDTDGTETVYENCNSVVDIDTLLADIDAPFGYKAALSIEKNGEPITGSINLVSDAKLYVVYTADETLDMTYGKALVIVDLEREGVDGWWGMSQDVANTSDSYGAYVYEVASYYDSRFEGQNFRIRFIANESPRVDQVMVEDENGNHYITGTNTTMWPQVTNSNFGSVAGEAGTYTYMFDVMLGEGSESKVIGTPKTMIQANTGATGVWETVITQSVLEADGTLPSNTWANFGFSATNVATVSFDNAKIFWKPFTASVDVIANGAVVATKTGVATDGVVASTFTDGVKIKGYNITGVKLGTTEYALTDTIVLPGDCEVSLVLEEQPYNYATPNTSEEKAVRVDDPAGIRFKANLELAYHDDTTTAYGWIVTRESLLTEAGIAAADFTMDSNVKMSAGYNYGNGTTTAKIFEQDDTYAWFTAILYFSATESDGLPSADKLAGKLVARPFAIVDGETLYGEPTAPASMYDVAYAIWGNEEAWNALDGNAQTYLDDLMVKVEDAGLGN